MIDPKGVSDKIKDRIDQIDRQNMIRPALDGKTKTTIFFNGAVTIDCDCEQVTELKLCGGCGKKAQKLQMWLANKSKASRPLVHDLLAQVGQRGAKQAGNQVIGLTKDLNANSQDNKTLGPYKDWNKTSSRLKLVNAQCEVHSQLETPRLI